jgi:hypothetical protein
MKQHCRDYSTHSENDSKAGPFEIVETIQLHILDRHHWSFAFTHASTSSKCILLAIRRLFQFNSFLKFSWAVEWIVSEMIDWLKVRDPALIKDIFFNPDNWVEPNSRSSTARSADRLDGRCKQEN